VEPWNRAGRSRHDVAMSLARAFLLIVVAACGGKMAAPAATPSPEPSPTPVVAVKPAAADAPSAELGMQLFETKGCIACHTTDGSVRVGPSLKGAFGTEVKLEDGATVLFDEAYFRESVLSPQAKLHAGFTPVHPSYEGQLSDHELASLLAFIRSLQ